MGEIGFDFKDSEGYPTKEFLTVIEEYDETQMTLVDFVCWLENGWWMPDWGYVLKRKYRGHRTLELHTGGWSGNEEIIYALRDNLYFWPFCWKMTRAGGHFYFKIPLKEKS